MQAVETNSSLLGMIKVLLKLRVEILVTFEDSL